MKAADRLVRRANLRDEAVRRFDERVRDGRRMGGRRAAGQPAFVQELHRDGDKTLQVRKRGVGLRDERCVVSRHARAVGQPARHDAEQKVGVFVAEALGLETGIRQDARDRGFDLRLIEPARPALRAQIPTTVPIVVRPRSSDPGGSTGGRADGGAASGTPGDVEADAVGAAGDAGAPDKSARSCAPGGS